MIGGVKFEHAHRMIAEFVGLLTIIVALWTWRVDKRRWMRGLTIGAVLGVIFQGSSGRADGAELSSSGDLHGPRNGWPDHVLRAGGDCGLHQPELAG